MKILLLVGAGSFIGGIARYLLGQAVQIKFISLFPYGTLIVNIIGCFLIGLLFELSAKAYISHEWRIFLAIGICGGFTTFSAFSVESVNLFSQGQIISAFAYVAASVLLGLVATFLGIVIIRLF